MLQEEMILSIKTQTILFSLYKPLFNFIYDQKVQHSISRDCFLDFSSCFSSLWVTESSHSSYDSGVIGAANLFIPYSIPSYTYSDQ